MYLEHFELHTSPFREEIDPEIFFPDAGRDAICRKLQADLEDGKPFVKLIGQEGSGKTLLCKVLFEQLTGDFEVIYLENPTGSFDDLLHIICLDLGMEPIGEQMDPVEELKQLLRRRKKSSRRVVFVFDDAEKIFLATLERLLRLLCELSELSVCTFLFAGRPSLNTNLEQLTVYCTGVDIENGYRLQAMTLEESGRYLIYRLLAAGLNSKKHREVFTGEALEKIYKSAAGNPRMTNILAEEALRKSCSEKSFMVLLDHVGTEPGLRKDNKQAAVPGFFQVLGEKKRLLAAGGIVVVLLAILFFLFSGPEEFKKPPIQQGTPAVTDARPVEQDKVPGSMPLKVQAPEKTAAIPVEQRQEQSVSIQATAKKEVPPRQDIKEVKEKKLIAGVAARNGEELFQERLRASAAWLAGAYRGQYTIQLMMLASGQAESNVKKLLVQDDYFSIIDNLHILRKKTTPPTLFVFYGTFPSMDAARQVRNKMPVFLRKHHPYALSIADALTKTED